MAKTGIKITTADTVLGRPNDVNSTSMLFFLDRDIEPVSGRSLEEFKVKLAEYDNTEEVLVAIERYFNPSEGLSLTGNLLWVAGWDTQSSDYIEQVVPYLYKTVERSYDERPRQIIFVNNVNSSTSPLGTDDFLPALHAEGFRCVVINSRSVSSNDLSILPDLTTRNEPFAAECIVAREDDAKNGRFFGGIQAGALLSTLSVGTSIGDGGLAPLSSPDAIAYASNPTRVSSLPLATLEGLGEKGYLFTRTRPPRNGLWWNDGATLNSPENALSTLEAARTICAIADDLQSFFVPYINSRVPVSNTGDIQSTYKQVVLDNARATVIQKYIESGDISDARINLVAKDNDMVGTRTWEVSLAILPAPTLRWVDGYVFYVKTLE